jgi:predicted SAM-dependent methyltransferase
MKIDIGCGTNKRTGYAGVDAVVVDGVEYVMDVTKGKLPFEDNSIEAVFSSHFLEHLVLSDALAVMTDAHRVLEGNGTVEVIVPNFPRLLELFLSAEFDDKWTWWIATIYGNQEHEGEFHKDGYDSDKIAMLLERAGFIDVVVEEVWTHNQPSLRATGKKKYVPVLV